MVGTLLDGRFQIERCLGRGGFGAVYDALDRAGGARVALKVVERPQEGADAHEARFLREVKNARRLESPHAVRVFEHGALADGRLWYTMELLEGRSLRAIMSAEGPLALPRAARLCGQMLTGLAAAHATGMVHRDVKPENVQVVAGPDGRELAKVLDFGLAKIGGGRASQDLSRGGEVSGTIKYMAPEHLQGAPVDARADIFAAGVVLYELVVGRRPFDADRDRMTIRAILSGTYVDPESARPRSASPALAAIIRRALERKVELRTSSAAAMAAALIEAVPEAAHPEACPPARSVAPPGDPAQRATEAATIGATSETRSMPTVDIARQGEAPVASDAASSLPTIRPAGAALATGITRAVGDRGRFALVRCVSRSARGEVWEGRDEREESPVAVRLLALAVGARAGFEEAVRAHAAVSHPAIARVIEGGMIGETEGWIASEWAAGVPLAGLFGGSAIAPEEAIAIARRILAGLGAAHAAGLVHGAVDPSRIVVAQDGDARLTGLGPVAVGRAADGPQARYAAPEALRGEKIDARADLYSLAAVLFEAIAGEPAIRGTKPTEIVRAALTGPAPQLPARLPERLRAALEPIFARGLARDPAARFADAAAFGAALAMLHSS